MIPKIKKYYFYLYRDFSNGDNPLNLIQLIAESNESSESSELSIEEKVIFSNRKELCEILFEDEWNSRNGKIQFFIEQFSTNNIENYYKNIIELIGVLKLDFDVSNLKKTLEFYRGNEFKIKELSINQEDQDWREKTQVLETKYDYYYYFSLLEKLAIEISTKPYDYCRDENGEFLNPDFTGKLKHYSENGILKYEYSLVNGQVLGEFIEYNNDGNIRELSIKNGYFKKDSIKRWFRNGQIKFEKINDSDCRYWYDNGQLEVENIGGIVKKWNRSGEKIL